MMLPLDLLRATSRRGHITPLFCSLEPDSDDLRLADRLTGMFRDAAATPESEGRGIGAGPGRGCGGRVGKTRGELLAAAAGMEHDHDHRLVRGLFAVLERRAEFAGPPLAVEPRAARRRIFEESAAQGLALSGGRRDSIMAAAAARAGIAPGDLEDAMWGDSDGRLLVRRFSPIDPGALAASYNMSLAQTLLFRCASMSVRLRGGVHWKRVLREVKRRRLMYVLEPAKGPDGRPRAEVASCVIEGQSSVLRMTDRYGTAMARVLPAVAASPGWAVSGTIVRHADGVDDARLYRFALSEKSHGGLLRPPVGAGAAGGGQAPDPPAEYDSAVEERFAAAFEARSAARPPGGAGAVQAADHLGWRLVREPDPLIAGDRAMIPDFAFERFGRRVYLEIVGFWTADYIRKKSEKIAALLEGGGRGGAPPVDLLVAVNSSLACSQGILDAGRGGAAAGAAAGRVFAFTGDVPLKPVLERLAAVDAEIIEEKAATGDVAASGKDGGDIVDAQEAAALHGMPVESAVMVMSRRLAGHTLVAGRYFVSPEKAAKVGAAVGDGGRFTDVCSILDGHEIPEQCHADLLSAIGYDVVWTTISPNNAYVTRRKRKRAGSFSSSPSSARKAGSHSSARKAGSPSSARKADSSSSSPSSSSPPARKAGSPSSPPARKAGSPSSPPARKRRGAATHVP